MLIHLLLSVAIAATPAMKANKIRKDEGCRVACIRSGHTGGYYTGKPSCVCQDHIDERYEIFVRNQISLPDDQIRYFPPAEPAPSDLPPKLEPLVW